jgi:phosphoglycerol transferase MdoB-like AlkP superfamily enzyme
MLATVDTHPPFNLAKDAVNYQDGRQPILNMFHTTDDAFGKFWQQFKQSPFYDNTILITVADHAVFPAAITRDLFPDDAGKLTYYDENIFLMYIPDSVLPKEVSTYASGLDFTPTLLQILNINIPNSFEGHSIFDDRKKFPNLLGMHELGLYINQVKNSGGKRAVDYNVPSEITCAANYMASSTSDLTLCDYLEFYKWKRQMFEEGRFWKKP